MGWKFGIDFGEGSLAMEWDPTLPSFRARNSGNPHSGKELGFAAGARRVWQPWKNRDGNPGATLTPHGKSAPCNPSAPGMDFWDKCLDFAAQFVLIKVVWIKGISLELKALGSGSAWENLEILELQIQRFPSSLPSVPGVWRKIKSN